MEPTFDTTLSSEDLNRGALISSITCSGEDDSDLVAAPLWVTVEPILAADKVRPIPLPQNESQFRSYYTPILFVSGVVWIAGLLAILFYGRGTLKKASIVTKTITPAEKKCVR